ncbi:MAG: hypothetical protein WBG71_09800 [Leeuwenhoekiella sp.]
MRRHIFMYLFFFAALWIIFQYANEKSIFESQENKIARRDAKIETLEKIVDSLENSSEELYFSLKRNENAYSYLERFDVPVVGLEQRLEDAVIGMNSAGGNALIPYESTTGGVFLINKVQPINHKWILADFSDGTQWGELLLGYNIDAEGSISFEDVAHVIYPLSR